MNFMAIWQSWHHLETRIGRLVKTLDNRVILIHVEIISASDRGARAAARADYGIYTVGKEYGF